VPGALREAALALGAARWEAIRVSVLPYAEPGSWVRRCWASARALGGRSVTMVIGNSPTIRPPSSRPDIRFPP